ncbi:MAG TPA: peptide-methionine (S)-S-oxide reductase MsrA [Alphaproteobacteria bacterium]
MSVSSAYATDVKTEKALFAGGCFWCMHAAFEQLPGVTKVLSGYSGGTIENPTYEQVSTGETGHIEAIEITYDPAKTSYDTLLEHFWENVDPTDPRGQFCDKGSQYVAGIFYNTPEQQQAAELSIKKVEERLNRKVATFLRPAQPFYEAEDYHQSYYQKNALRYELYKKGCGRDEKLEKIWNKS